MFDKQPEEWHTVKVEHIAARDKHACVGGPFGSNLIRKDYVETPGVPVSRGSNLTLGERFFKDDDFVFVSEEKAISLIQNTAYPGDIVFTQRGTIGQVALIPKNSKFRKYILSQNQMKLTPDPTKADVGFLLYYFLSPIAQEIILRNSIGSTIPGFNLTQLRQFPVPLPPLTEQKAIAHILGTLDEKIELNREMNQTLEAMARAIFKSWFVDFDPVRAKMEGRQPAGMDAATAELFPDEFEESALGMIPKGWKISTIGESVKVVGGGTPSTKNLEYWEGGTFNWTTPKDLSSLQSPVLLNTERKITELGLKQISSGLLPKGTVLLSSRAPIGYIVISDIPVAINQGYIAMICDGKLPNYYILQWTLENLEIIKGRANGTTFLEISKSNFRPIGIVIPESKVLQTFTLQVEALHQQIVNNLKQSGTLASIRDTLLPKLLSGEIRIKEAEKMVENVA